MGRVGWPTTPPPSFFAPDTVREKRTTEEKKLLRALTGEAEKLQEQTIPLDILDEIQ